MVSCTDHRWMIWIKFNRLRVVDIIFYSFFLMSIMVYSRDEVVKSSPNCWGSALRQASIGIRKVGEGLGNSEFMGSLVTDLLLSSLNQVLDSEEK